MRITESQLRRIISQEIRRSLLESDRDDLNEAISPSLRSKLAAAGLAATSAMGFGSGEASARSARKPPVESMLTVGQERLRAFDETTLKLYAGIAAEKARLKGKTPEADALSGISKDGFKARFFTDPNFKVSGRSVADEWMRAYEGEM